MLQKGIYPCEYIDDWEKFNEITLPEKEDFCSHLNMEDIIDADFSHTKRVNKDFEIKNLGEYHDFYVQSDALLLVNVFENFRNMCLEIYALDPAKFLSAPGLGWQAALKKTKVELDLLADIQMLLMVEKGLGEEYVTLFIDMQKLMTSTSKIMIKIKNRHIFNIGM